MQELYDEEEPAYSDSEGVHPLQLGYPAQGYPLQGSQINLRQPGYSIPLVQQPPPAYPVLAQQTVMPVSIYCMDDN